MNGKVMVRMDVSGGREDCFETLTAQLSNCDV